MPVAQNNLKIRLYSTKSKLATTRFIACLTRFPLMLNPFINPHCTNSHRPMGFIEVPCDHVYFNMKLFKFYILKLRQ